QYAQASLKRRLYRRVHAEGLATLSQLQDRLLHDPPCMERLLVDLSINVTSMFRDPSFYVAFREKIVPVLHTYPFTRVWCAGCSTGEEVYSLAILLHEEGLYDKTRIYATDINEHVLQTALEGVFPLERMKQYTQNYIRGGGKGDFSEYYVAAYDSVRFARSLTENVVFAQHNLAMDRSFNEFNAIVCRNVMIYFDKTLQDHVHGLFYESLTTFGILALGHKESIGFTRLANRYEEIDADERIYRKVA
ncbi:MAG: chemotaxis protein methyltransferase CheR, partial [Gaiellaceae bacterium]|nr:chemotaxis protein methyltransferase CheR [Gaiellaceae bacterium]